MQKQSLEQHLNGLERESYINKCKTKELDKVVKHQSEIIEQQKQRINWLEESNLDLHNKLFLIREEKQELQNNNCILESQLKNLQEQLLQTISNIDQSQIEYDLQKERGLNSQLKNEIQILQSQLDHLELERQKLEEELKTKSLNQIIYINNDALTNVLQNYNQYFENFNNEKQYLLNQIQQYKALEEKTKIDNQKRIDRFQVIIKNVEDKKKILEEEIINLKNVIENQQKTLENQQIQLQEQEKLRLELEKEQQIISEQNISLQQQQQEQIVKLQKQINSSHSIVYDMMNIILPSDMEEILQIKQQLLKNEEEMKSLKEINKNLSQEKKKFQDLVEKELPFVKQRKQEFEQLMAISLQQKKKLEVEINLNKKLKENLNQLEIELQQVKQKEEIQTIEILKLRSENLTCRTQIQELSVIDLFKNQSQVSNTDAQVFIKQICQENEQLKNQIEQILINYQSYNRPINQSDQIQEENLNLKYTLSVKEDEILNLKEKVNIMTQEKALGQIINNKVQPIVHKIEKIKIKTEKQQNLLKEFRNQRMEKRKLEFKLEELEFQISKLQSQYQLERQQKEFLEKRLIQQKDDFGKKKEQFRKRYEEFEIKIQELQQEMNLSSITQEHINYYQQNRMLFQKSKKDKQLIIQQNQEIKNYIIEIQRLKEELHNKEQEVIAIERQAQNGDEDQKRLQLKKKIQMDKDKIQIEDLYEQLNQQIKEKVQLNNQFLKEKLKCEQIQINLNSDQSLQELKKSVYNFENRLIQFQEQSQKRIEELEVEFQNKIGQKQNEISQLEQEIIELKYALEDYKKQYKEEKLKQVNKSELSLNEIQDLKEQLSQTIKEKDQLLKRKQMIEKKDSDLKIKEEIINAREQKINEEQILFEQTRIKQTQEIQEQISIQKNKELSLIACDYIIFRELDEYKQKLIQEQNKVNELLQQLQMQQNSQDNDNNQQQQLNQIGNNEQKQEGHEQEIKIEEINVNNGMKIEEQQNFDEERQMGQQGVQEKVNQNEVKFVMEIIQNGKLLAYLEKAKQIHEEQKDKTGEN
ncbi:unnamed protein product [Paramecium pentaurelia]|uniref:Uncharacterized protein n=1 Tax=Paramecium pentaurelia TaxID=43138 RepID=A0A8S1X9K4_9CILI|nr:unnamed protein product [Paramecium pentaurelia]